MRKPKKKGKLKLKTKRAAVKRFRMTATGKIKRGQSMKRHILTKKAPGRRRGLGAVGAGVGRGRRAGQADAAVVK